MAPPDMKFFCTVCHKITPARKINAARRAPRGNFVCFLFRPHIFCGVIQSVYSPRKNCSREVSFSCSGFIIVRLSVKYFISLLSQYVTNW